MENNNYNKTKNWFLHIDLDAFFASVEQLDNPVYRGKPVIVGGLKDDIRGVVSTASYEARKYGVHSAMPIFQAVKLCPQGIFVRGRMKRYAEISYKIMNIFKEFSPDVDQMSIDEAFIDLTGTEQLFGPPEKTAQKVKQRVKELTGLTVSVGLATTKYLAKIASGYSKPDGFYFIKPGDEQNFMLSLPLKKVWGIGPKTLERLKKAGINSTKDIYDKPLDLLQFLFGTSMSNFLYNIVRGKENESFIRQPKSHSISGEKTFSYDIEDIYTAETELLELAHGVMFRILKEEKFSRTVTVKIKYDDFTSVTIQKTVDRNIITLDSFFEIIKELFEDKYQKGRGIRLLGVGFDKVTSNNSPQQQSLFENKDDKKQAVEKAILDLNKKHPEIQIKKARLLKTIAIIFIIFFELSNPIHNNKILYATENTVSIKGAGSLLPESTNSPSLPEMPNKETENGAIFNWNINDKNKVDFNITGSWQGEVKGNFLSTFGKNTPFNFQTTIPIFKQDIELSTLITLNNQWYFEGNFADNFDNNTLTLGYKGNNYFRSAKLSNRNITMPDIYSAEQFGYGLAGGNTQSPGFSAHWQSPTDKWSADILLRYDMTTQKSSIYYGLNKINEHIIKPEDYLRGHSFTFPLTTKKYLKQMKDIYVEDKNGKYADSRGLLYRKLSASDYFYSYEKNILYISKNAKGYSQDGKIPSILITFLDDNTAEKIKAEAGSYKDENSFLGKIQKLFNNENNYYDLSKFQYEIISNIENSKALIIQNSYGFSPFLMAGTYDCGTAVNNDISVILRTTKQNVKNYEVNIIDQSFITPNKDFLNLEHTFAYIKNNYNGNSQFPFADISPEIYLNLKSQSDLALLQKNYTSVNNINIGTKASAGSIQIYKNGAYYTDFVYDPKTGNIKLGGNINSTDILKIYYQEESSNYSNGNFSFGLGYFLNIFPELQWDISLTGQHPIVFKDTIPTIENLQNSFISLTTGINYQSNNFIVNDKITGYIKKTNPYDKLLVSTQQDSLQKIYEHDYYSGYETKTVPIIPNENLLEENNRTIINHYGEQDDLLKTFTIPLEWDFSNKNEVKKPLWAAVDIKLKGGNLLKNSSQLKFKIKLENILPANSANFYLQLGISAGSDDKNKSIRTFEINSNKIDYNNTDWQDITILLEDTDRALLVSDYDCRIIIVQKNNYTEKGKISIGPYIPVTKNVFAKADENINITTSSVISGTDNYSSLISWNFNKDIAIDNKLITVSSYFSPADFNSYNLINFKFAYTNNNAVHNNDSSQSVYEKNIPDLTFILDSGSMSLNSSGNEAVKIIIKDIVPYINETKKYHTLSLNLKDKNIFIDGHKISNDKGCVEIINKNIVPSRFIIKINPFTSSEIISSGNFFIDNITYEENDFNFGMENHIETSYQKDNILKIKSFPVFKNGYIFASSTQKLEDNKITVLSSLDTGINIAGIDIHGDFSMNQLNINNGGHSISTNGNIFNFLSISEDYRWQKNDFINKNNNLSMDFNKIKIPIVIKSANSSYSNNLNKTQNQSLSINSIFNISKIGFNIQSSINNFQKKILENDNQIKESIDNYFINWYEITKYEFSMGHGNANTRSSNFNNSISLDINNNFISPSISYNLSCIYNKSEQANLTDKPSISIYVPINLKNNFISIKLTKTAEDSYYTEPGGSYFTDLKNMFLNQTKHKYFYTSIPFYDLFDMNIKNKLFGNYSTSYEMNFKKKLYNSFKDLFIPSGASLMISRDSKMKNKYSDIYQIKASITNTSINNFGRNSKKHIFSWFNQEEIISSLSTVVRIPTDEINNISYDISAYLQMMFIINENSILNTAFDYTISTNQNWNTKGTFVFSRKGKSSIITDLAKLIWVKANNINYKITRKDSFNYELGKSDKILKQQYDYFHSLDINLLENFTFSTGLGLSFAHIQNKASSLWLNYSLGGKISF